MYNNPLYSDPTEYQRLEATRPIYRNPYEVLSPYSGEMPPAPPPPLKQRHTGFLVALVSVGCFVLLIAGAFFVMVYVGGKPGSTQATHSTVQPFVATSVIRDFQTQGLPLDQLKYGMTLTQFIGSGYDTVITTQSSAMFVDPSFCSGPCGTGSVWLGVYNSPVDAQSEYNGLVAYRTAQESQPGPGLGALASLVQSGRCVLMGEPATSQYAAALRSVCP